MSLTKLRHLSILCHFLCIYLVKSHDVHNMFARVDDTLPDKSKEHQQKVNKDSLKYVDIPSRNARPGEAKEAASAIEYKTILIAYRQVVQTWLKKFPSTNAKKYRFLVDISPKQLQRLSEFASSTEMDPKTALRDVHTATDLLQQMIQFVEEDVPVYDGLTWSAWIRSFDINAVVKGGLVVAVAGMISFIGIHGHLKKGRWITALLIFAFIVSFLMNWYNLYLDAQAEMDEIMMKQVPKHCLGHPKTFWESVKEKVNGYVAIPTDECRKHFRSARGFASLKATPAKAFIMTVTDICLTPLGALGENLSKFFAGTMLHVPGIMWPIVITIIIVVFVVIVLICSKDELSAGYGLFAARRTQPAAIAANVTNIVGQIENTSNNTDQIKALQDQIQDLQKQLCQRPVLALENKVEVKEEVKPKVKEELQEEEEEEIKLQPVTTASPDSTLTQRKPPPPGFRTELLSE